MLAKTLVNTKNLSREEWLKYRQLGIGGSDAAAIANCNPYKSSIRVYLEKTAKEVEEYDNERMKWGRILEPVIAEEFAVRHEVKVRQKNAILQHPDYPYIIGDVDRLIVGKKEGLECKTTDKYNWRQWEGENVPDMYYIQCQHYMMLTGYTGWWMAVLIGGNEYKDFYIPRNDELIQSLLQAEINFWTNYVLPKVMPNPDGSKDYSNILTTLYPGGIKEEPLQIPQFIDYHARFKQNCEQIKSLESANELIKQEIQSVMGNYELAYIGDKKVKWSTCKGNVSWKNVAEKILDLTTINLDEFRGKPYRKFEMEA